MDHLPSVISLVVALAVTEPAARATAERLYESAEREEKALDLKDALADYEASVAADPSNRYVLRANARAGWLRDRSEGDFAPLVRLERVRRQEGSQRDAAEVDALAGDLEKFPAGEVRVEARMFVAEAYATKLARPRDAERELDALLDEPRAKSTADGPIRSQAATRLADIAMARADVASAKGAAARVASIDPELVVRVAHWARRRILERVAVAALALFAILAGQAAARRLRGARARELVRFVPRAAAICVYLTIVATALANAFERGNATPFVMLPASVLAIAVAARAWSLAGSSSPAARAARATFGAVAVASAALLVLAGIDVRYLESFGL
ncbi:MAG TPA: hypothetical protein VGH28_28630 [Polyangiaceae bacterium]